MFKYKYIINTSKKERLHYFMANNLHVKYALRVASYIGLLERFLSGSFKFEMEFVADSEFECPTCMHRVSE